MFSSAPVLGLLLSIPRFSCCSFGSISWIVRGVQDNTIALANV